jgi:hypothetical protein
MANFMIAHLAEGRFGAAQLLPPETARRMQARQFSVHPDVAGWGYGFQESFLNGHRAVGHGGDWRGFKSRLLLFPQHGFGIFVSVNGDVDDLAFWGAFEAAFAARYLPGAAPAAPAPPPDFLRAAGRYTGVYVPNRRMRSDLLKLGALVTHARVHADAGGLTLVAGDIAFRLVPTGPDLFHVEALGENAFFFAEPDTGVEHLVIGPFLTLDKAAGWANPRLHAALGLAAAALFAGTLAGWGLGLAARRFAGAAPSPVTPLARGVGAGAAALLLGGLAGVASQLEPERIFDVMIALPAGLVAALVALHLAVPFVLATAWLAVRRAAVPGAKAPLARLHYAALAGAGLLTLAQALTWNLLGPAAFR